MIKRTFKAVILVLVMFFTASVPVNVLGVTKFSDIRGHWAEKYINEAVSQGIIKGYQDGTFKPDNAVTRAEFISMVNRALKCTGTTSISFNDVPYSEWYYSDISKAVAATYVAGYEDNTFKPDSPISRQEVSVMISRFVPTYNYSGNLKNYPDYRSVDDWAYTALSKINGKGYIGAYSDGKIHPRDQLTRGQTAKILCEILAKESIVSSDTSVSKDGTKLSGKIYTNNVTVLKDLGDNEMTLDNSIVLGTLYVQGGGTNSVTINNCRIANASVNRSASAVRVYAKGETTVANLTAANSSILQTASLSGGTYGLGFAKVNLSNSADSILRGSFPKVYIDGSSSKVNLESGSISELTVESAGRRSDITVASGATVSEATVNAESYFHGNGNISNMKVNADNITYETKPRNWTIASRINTPKASDSILDMTISPANKATKVKLDTDITITFSTAMTKYDGRSISNSDISNFIELRKGSSSGKSVSFSASINSAKKVITLDPTSNLETNERYYIIIDKNAMKDTYGQGNSSQTSYFDTGDTSQSFSVSFDPSNKATTISVNPSITISFSESVVRYSDGKSISSSDISNIVYLRRQSNSGSDINYTVSDYSSRKIVIRPKSSLDLNTTYYVGINSRALKTSANNTAVSADYVYWSTGVTTPIVNGITLEPGNTSILAKVTSNVSGKAYAIVVPSGSSAPSASQIAAGQNSNGLNALASAKNDSISAGTAASLAPVMNGLASGNAYDVWVTVYSPSSGTYATPVKQSTTTTLPKAVLSGLEVSFTKGGTTGNNVISFNPETYVYNLNVHSDVTAVDIKAKGAGKIKINNGSSTDSEATGSIPITKSGASIPIEISYTGVTTSTYMINVNVADDCSLKTLSIGGNRLTSDDGSFSYDLSTNSAISIKMSIETNDVNAVIDSPTGTNMSVTSGDSGIGSAIFDLDISEGTTSAICEFKVKSGTTVKKYTIVFIKPLS